MTQYVVREAANMDVKHIHGLHVLDFIKRGRDTVDATTSHDNIIPFRHSKCRSVRKQSFRNINLLPHIQRVIPMKNISIQNTISRHALHNKKKLLNKRQNTSARLFRCPNEEQVRVLYVNEVSQDRYNKKQESQYCGLTDGLGFKRRESSNIIQKPSVQNEIHIKIKPKTTLEFIDDVIQMPKENRTSLNSINEDGDHNQDEKKNRPINYPNNNLISYNDDNNRTKKSTRHCGRKTGHRGFPPAGPPSKLEYSSNNRIARPGKTMDMLPSLDHTESCASQCPEENMNMNASDKLKCVKTSSLWSDPNVTKSSNCFRNSPNNFKKQNCRLFQLENECLINDMDKCSKTEVHPKVSYVDKQTLKRKINECECTEFKSAGNITCPDKRRSIHIDSHTCRKGSQKSKEHVPDTRFICSDRPSHPGINSHAKLNGARKCECPNIISNSNLICPKKKDSLHVIRRKSVIGARCYKTATTGKVYRKFRICTSSFLALIWTPCLIVAALLWVITYPIRPHFANVSHYANICMCGNKNYLLNFLARSSLFYRSIVGRLLRTSDAQVMKDRNREMLCRSLTTATVAERVTSVILGSMLIIVWAPCLFVSLLFWLLTYPIRPHVAECNKNEEIYSSCVKNKSLWSAITNTMLYYRNLIVKLTGSIRTNLNTRQCKACQRGSAESIDNEPPNPSKKYVLYCNDSKWYVKPNKNTKKKLKTKSKYNLRSKAAKRDSKARYEIVKRILNYEDDQYGNNRQEFKDHEAQAQCYNVQSRQSNEPICCPLDETKVNVNHENYYRGLSSYNMSPKKSHIHHHYHHHHKRHFEIECDDQNFIENKNHRKDLACGNTSLTSPPVPCVFSTNHPVCSVVASQPCACKPEYKKKTTKKEKTKTRKLKKKKFKKGEQCNKCRTGTFLVENTVCKLINCYGKFSSKCFDCKDFYPKKRRCAEMYVVLDACCRTCRNCLYSCVYFISACLWCPFLCWSYVCCEWCCNFFPW